MLHQHLQPAGTTPAGLPSLALPAEIRAAIKAGAWIVFNVSGGKDSSAAMFAVSIVLDQLGHPRNRRLVIHADLGRAEWDSTPAMVERLAALADLPLCVVRRNAGDLFDRWAQRFENGKRRYEALETFNLIQAEILKARILNIFHTITEVNSHETTGKEIIPFPDVINKTFTG